MMKASVGYVKKTLNQQKQGCKCKKENLQFCKEKIIVKDHYHLIKIIILQ